MICISTILIVNHQIIYNDLIAVFNVSFPTGNKIVDLHLEVMTFKTKNPII